MIVILFPLALYTKSTGLWGCIKRGHWTRENREKKKVKRSVEREKKEVYIGKKNTNLFFVREKKCLACIEEVCCNMPLYVLVNSSIENSAKNIEMKCATTTI